MRVSSTIQQFLAFLGLAILIAIMMLMAWPRLLANLQFLPVQQTQLRLYQSSGLADADLPALKSRTELVISYHDAYSYHATLSLLHYLMATDGEASLYSRRQALDDSVVEARQALVGAPLQPELWLRMAQAGLQSFVPANELVDYFRMAVWSGRVEPTNLIARLQIGFSLQRNLDEYELNLLSDQVLLAWNLKQHEFRTAIRAGQLSYPRVVELINTTHPDVVREMEEIIGPVTL